MPNQTPGTDPLPRGIPVTRLHIPRPRAGLVSRARLLERLRRGLEAKLTLVSAPPGFGKTTLLAEWLAAVSGEGVETAWLQLDASDNEPAVFWSYVIGAVQRVRPGVGGQALAMLQASPQSPPEPVLASLINDLASIPGEVLLVLDDYHLIEERGIHEGLAYLLDHTPGQFHLVIASRADPPLPLARMRVRGELVEVRAADLRFSDAEAAAFLNGTMHLDLAEEQVAAQESRTEGWVAALQLAGLSVQGREDVAGFISDFKGDNRYIVDYLLEEALQQQPEDVRHFLLRTAILDRLGAALCEAVTGKPDAGGMLRYLEERNVLIVPLDDRREWYRYHHLFADVLRARLAIDLPGEEAELHRRASAWFATNGETAAAVRHAFAARDFEAAAALVEGVTNEMLRSRREAALRTWLEQLPVEMVRLRPVLSAGYAGALMNGGRFDGVEPWLRAAEDGLADAVHVSARHPGETERTVYVDERQFRETPGMIALYRAGLAQVAGDLEGAVAHAEAALERMAADEPLRGGALALLALAQWSNGNIDAARATYLEGIALVERGGYVHTSSSVILADLLVTQGRLREALSSYRRARDVATAQGASAPRGMADLLTGMSEVLREQGRLDEAAERLAEARDLGDYAQLPENRYRWSTAMAQVRRSQGDSDGALELLDEAERLYTGGFHRMSGRSRRCGRGRGSPTEGWTKRRPGRASGASRRAMR